MNELTATPISGAPEIAAPHQSAVLSIAWIWLGICALVAAGLLSLALALSRTPLVQEWMPGNHFFRVALVVHVDLSVLVWFIACAGMLWTAYGRNAKPLWNKLALFVCASGTVMLTVAPFVVSAQPIMNNYVPVLEHPWFFCGLALIACALLIQAAAYLIGNPLRWREIKAGDLPIFALHTAAATALIALACIAFSYLRIEPETGGEFFFDLLFWGGGHVMQFMNTILMLLALLLLAQACGTPPSFSPRIGLLLFALVFAPLLSIPWLYSHPTQAREHILGFTALMQYGGMAAIPMLACFLPALVQRPQLDAKTRPLRAAMLSSLTLFGAGGIMGFMIMGSNTVIPAHYHGSTVGVTLAFMGMIYLLLARFGKTLTMPRAAHWQPYLYGGGQLMHITALAWTGGYGVKRKVAGAAQELDSVKEIVGMSLMGFGGLIAVIGGVLFCVVVISALLQRDTMPAPA